MVSKYVYVESPDGLMEAQSFMDPAIPHSFISERFFRNLAVPYHQVESVVVNIRGELCRERYVWIQVFVDGKRFREKCRVIEGLSEDLVLGAPALARFGFAVEPDNVVEQKPAMLMRMKARPIGEEKQ